VHNVSDIRHIEVHNAEPLVPGLSRLVVKIATAKLKKYKSPCSYQIPAELIQAGETLLSVTHKLIDSIWNKEELPNQWKDSFIYQFTSRVAKLTAIIIAGYHCYQLHIKFYRISSSLG
jgi:hypothetical protein